MLYMHRVIYQTSRKTMPHFTSVLSEVGDEESGTKFIEHESCKIFGHGSDFRDVMPCSMVEVYRCLRQMQTTTFIFNPEDGGSTFFQNIGRLKPDGITS
jgi:hypothetical protein